MRMGVRLWPERDGAGGLTVALGGDIGNCTGNHADREFPRHFSGKETGCGGRFGAQFALEWNMLSGQRSGRSLLRLPVRCRR